MLYLVEFYARAPLCNHSTPSYTHNAESPSCIVYCRNVIKSVTLTQRSSQQHAHPSIRLNARPYIGYSMRRGPCGIIKDNRQAVRGLMSLQIKTSKASHSLENSVYLKIALSAPVTTMPYGYLYKQSKQANSGHSINSVESTA